MTTPNSRYYEQLEKEERDRNIFAIVFSTIFIVLVVGFYGSHIVYISNPANKHKDNPLEWKWGR